MNLAVTHPALGSLSDIAVRLVDPPLVLLQYLFMPQPVSVPTLRPPSPTQCPVCATHYKDEEELPGRKPMIMVECRHTICLDCGSARSRCPMCKTPFSKLETSWTLLELLGAGSIVSRGKQ